MDSYENVLVGSIAIAVLCISFSTWITLSDLRALVFEAEGSDALVHGGDKSFARAVQQLEHPLRSKRSSAATSSVARSEKQIADSWGQCFVQENTEYAPSPEIEFCASDRKVSHQIV